MTDWRMLQRGLEETISRDARAIVLKKISLNAFSSVCRLPPELLSEILLSYVERQFAGAVQNPITGLPMSPYAWIKVTHVCHRWRQVALSFSYLWRNIICTDTIKDECVFEMLERSRGCNQLVIKISVGMTPRRSSGPMDAMFMQLHRVQSLHLDTSSSPGFPQSLNSSPVEWPYLTTLVLSHTVSRMGPEIAAVFKTRIMPRLRTVEMEQFHIKWNHPILCRPLIKLVLRTADMPGALSVLQGMPELEYLALSNSFWTLPHDSARVTLPVVQQHINLPCLHHLHLDGEPTQVCYLFNHLVLPVSTTILLRLASTSPTTSMKSMASAVMFRVQSLLMASLFSCLVFRDMNSLYWIELYTRPIPVQKVPNLSTPPSIQIAFNGCASEAYEIAEDFFLSFPLDRMEQVCLGPLNIKASVFKTSVKRLLAQMSNVSTLRLITQYSIDVLDQVLKSRVEDPTVPKKGARYKLPCIVPHLHTLILEGAYFRSASKGLVSSLRSRSKSGLKLQRLVLNDAYGLDASMVQNMRNSWDVETLEWDGIERGVTTSLVPGA